MGVSSHVFVFGICDEYRFHKLLREMCDFLFGNSRKSTMFYGWKRRVLSSLVVKVTSLALIAKAI